jgi:hypothetical protein
LARLPLPIPRARLANAAIGLRNIDSMKQTASTVLHFSAASDIVTWRDFPFCSRQDWNSVNGALHPTQSKSFAICSPTQARTLSFASVKVPGVKERFNQRDRATEAGSTAMSQKDTTAIVAFGAVLTNTPAAT